MSKSLHEFEEGGFRGSVIKTTIQRPRFQLNTPKMYLNNISDFRMCLPAGALQILVKFAAPINNGGIIYRIGAPPVSEKLIYNFQPCPRLEIARAHDQHAMNAGGVGMMLDWYAREKPTESAEWLYGRVIGDISYIYTQILVHTDTFMNWYTKTKWDAYGNPVDSMTIPETKPATGFPLPVKPANPIFTIPSEPENKNPVSGNVVKIELSDTGFRQFEQLARMFRSDN
jgi:hypothetical protein